MSKNDIFILSKIFPNAAEIFATSSSNTQSIKDSCIFVLDTNALALPYSTSSKSLVEIQTVYKKLVEEQRLIIPGQVAREFARVRPTKIKELYQQLNSKKANSHRKVGEKYQLLTGIDEYNSAIELEDKIQQLTKEYQNKLSGVMNHIKNWTWNDPISLVYQALFTSETIEDFLPPHDSFKEEMANRFTHGIPPGYDDKGKPDGGYGDLLIWYTIIEIAKKRGKDIIFVTGEEKNDWFYISESQILYPRFELVCEFKAKTNNKNISIIKLSEMIELFGISNSIIDELKVEEKNQSIYSTASKLTIKAVISMVIEDFLFNTIHSITTYFATPFYTFPENAIELNDGTRIGVVIIQITEISELFNEFQIYFNKLDDDKTIKFTSFIFICVLDSEYSMDTIIDDYSKIMKLINRSNYKIDLNIGFIKNAKFLHVL